MKKITYSVAFVATLLATSNTFAQQGFGTNTPHRSAAVEIKSTNKGLLIPRVALNSETQKLNTSVDNANSLMVFNETGLLDKGYYYWDENFVVTPAQGNTPAVTGKWILFATGNSVSALNGQNAVTRNGNFFELGGSLNRETQITLNGNKFTIASGDNNFAITGLTDGYTSLTNFVPKLMVQDGVGKVYTAEPNALLNQFLKGKNGITIAQNDNMELEVKLGGTIDEVTNLHIADNASVSVSGLKKMNGTSVTSAGLDESVVALGGGHLIPVGTTMNGTLRVATAKEIVDAGIVSVENDYFASVFNPDGSINEQGTLVTKVNNEASNAINIGQIVRAEQTKTVVSSGSDVVTVNTTTNGDTTTYTVAIDASDLVAEGVEANNGLTKTGSLIQLGGPLTQDTTIDTGNYNVKIRGLEHYNNGLANAGGVSNNTASILDLGGNVVPVGNANDGTLRVATAEDIVKAGLKVDSGLEYVSTGFEGADSRTVALGGDLHRATTLTTTATNTLAIDGLQNASTGNKRILIERVGEGANAHDVLRTVERLYNYTQQTGDLTLSASDTNIYEEVNITFKLSGVSTVTENSTTPPADAKLTLPEASTANKGQVINVKLSGDTNDIQFLAIYNGSTKIAEGSMPFQSWIFKSNGSAWEVVSRM